MYTKKFLIGTTSAVIGFIMSIGAAVAADCSTSTLSGIYGFQAEGMRVVNGKPSLYNAVRTAVFDGKGEQTGKGSAAFDGKIVEYSLTAKYTVNADCSFTVDGMQTYIASGPPTEYKQFGMIVDGGKEMMVVQTTYGQNQSGRYFKVN